MSTTWLELDGGGYANLNHVRKLTPCMINHFSKHKYRIEVDLGDERDFLADYVGPFDTPEEAHQHIGILLHRILTDGYHASVVGS